jgi:hypothetical protein
MVMSPMMPSPPFSDAEREAVYRAIAALGFNFDSACAVHNFLQFVATM